MTSPSWPWLLPEGLDLHNCEQGRLLEHEGTLTLVENAIQLLPGHHLQALLSRVAGAMLIDEDLVFSAHDEYVFRSSKFE